MSTPQKSSQYATQPPDLGSGLSYITVEAAYREFSHIGLTLESFYALLGALRVPILHLSPTTPPILRAQSLRLALLAISRIGQPNFSLEEGSTLTLPTDSPDYTNLVIELLFSRSTFGDPPNALEARTSTTLLARFLVDTLSKLQSEATHAALLNAYTSSKAKSPTTHTIHNPPKPTPPTIACPPKKPTTPLSNWLHQKQTSEPSSPSSRLTPWASPSSTPSSLSQSFTPNSSKTFVPPNTRPGTEPPASSPNS